jgi:hypothetical protein
MKMGNKWLSRARRASRLFLACGLPVLLRDVVVVAADDDVQGEDRGRKPWCFRSIPGGLFLRQFLRDGLGCDKFSLVRSLKLPHGDSYRTSEVEDPFLDLLQRCLPHLESLELALSWQHEPLDGRPVFLWLQTS